jgi:hypothetical protein
MHHELKDGKTGPALVMTVLAFALLVLPGPKPVAKKDAKKGK